jgi:hypothetical protein
MVIQYDVNTSIEDLQVMTTEVISEIKQKSLQRFNTLLIENKKCKFV